MCVCYDILKHIVFYALKQVTGLPNLCNLTDIYVITFKAQLLLRGLEL